ncbi:MAG: hypothetical protein D6680_05800 [Cyanobacteria bacterium J007]|nr:MAG: hypothetical protein D6680_05800 [Cyanobacteria bacterium J007]
MPGRDADGGRSFAIALYLSILILKFTHSITESGGDRRLDRGLKILGRLVSSPFSSEKRVHGGDWRAGKEERGGQRLKKRSPAIGSIGIE